jgi:hypothetical protein
LKTQSPHRVDVQALEARVLFSTTYNANELLGYVTDGAVWKYKESSSVSGDVKSPSSSSGTGKVTVAQQSSKIFKDTISDGGGNSLIFTLKRNSTNDQLTKLQLKANDKTALKTSLKNAQFTPTSLKLGKNYKGAGTYSGTFFTKSLGTIDIDGDAATSMKLIDVESVKVPAGTFADAVKGKSVVDLNGGGMFSYQGQDVDVPFEVKQTLSFWAVPGTGVVKSTLTMVITADIPIQGTVKITFKGKSQLKSGPGVVLTASVASPSLFATAKSSISPDSVEDIFSPIAG